MKSLALRGLLCAIATVFAPIAASADTMWAIGGDGMAIVKIDTQTGAGVVVGPIGVDATYGMTFTPDGTLYAALGQTELGVINQNTGVGTVIGSGFGPGIYSEGLVSNSTGQLYLASYVDEKLYTVNKTTSAISLVGYMGVEALAVSFDPNGTLWLLGHNQQLWTIDTTTGAGTYQKTITGAPYLVSGISFGHDGTLYALDSEQSSKLFTVNLANGVATAVGSTGVFAAWGGTFAPAVPLPPVALGGIFLMGGLGLVQLACRSKNQGSSREFVK